MLTGYVVAFAAVLIAYKFLQPAPDALDLTTTKNTSAQYFAVSIAPKNPNFRPNSLHTWIATITSGDGTPVENAAIAIDGNMPLHNHGLPTKPQMTKYLGAGRYSIEGVQFHMQGLWEFNLSITANAISDTVTFSMVF